jgi:hypothetical protein
MHFGESLKRGCFANSMSACPGKLERRLEIFDRLLMPSGILKDESEVPQRSFFAALVADFSRESQGLLKELFGLRITPEFQAS